MTNPVTYEVTGDIAVITVNNPPVNALSAAVRRGIDEAIRRFSDDTSARAAVLLCQGRTFFAGADISEFDKPVEAPWLPDVVAGIEACDKLMVAAIHGTALGGGLETAMGCHYRCAIASAKVGLPEVKLGLLPGASGTQRLPRLVGVAKALDIMLSGNPISAAEAQRAGIIDEIVEGELRGAAIDYARRLADGNAPIRRISEMAVPDAQAAPQLIDDCRKTIARTARGFFAPQQIIKCVEAAVNLPYQEALQLEHRLFDECKATTQSKAQRHLFFAEREVAKIPDIPKDTECRPLDSIAIIGGGTMGAGIAIACVNTGLPVTLVEIDQENLDCGLKRIRDTYADQVQRGRISATDLESRMGLIKGVNGYGAISDCDVVIEAVFENLALKKRVFAELDGVCKPGAVLATNTSTLDVDAIADCTGRPEDVVGLHFFAPANVMRLLEIVRGAKTSPTTLATALALSKRLKKVGVVSGVCFGFIGNRMMMPYVQEAQQMVLEGIPPERVDKVAYDWGMAMGPLAVVDLSGVDVMCKVLDDWPDRPAEPAFSLILRLQNQGYLGQKTGRGIYRYEGRKAIPEPDTLRISAAIAEEYGIERRDCSDQEIFERLFYPLINEGAAILQEGIALRPGDIDVVYANGYGFPRYRGGPMFFADLVGPRIIYDGICAYRDKFESDFYTPSPLLEQLAQGDKTFSAWAKE